MVYGMVQRTDIINENQLVIRRNAAQDPLNNTIHMKQGRTLRHIQALP